VDQACHALLAFWPRYTGGPRRPLIALQTLRPWRTLFALRSLLAVVSRVFRTFGFELSGARYWLKQ